MFDDQIDLFIQLGVWAEMQQKKLYSEIFIFIFFNFLQRDKAEMYQTHEILRQQCTIYHQPIHQHARP